MTFRPGLTFTERLALDAIREAVTVRGYPPSVRELAETLGVSSTSTVAHVLRSLSDKGAIRREYGKPRAITITDEGAA